MSEIALLDTRSQPFPLHEREPLSQHGLVPVDIYDLPTADLRPFAGLIVGGAADQEFLYLHRAVIENFLDDGKVIAFSGHLFRPWLPGCGMFVPKKIRSVADFSVHFVTPHPIFAGVDSAELTFRRGVAGFFSRGHHPPPAGAEILARLGDDEPIVYIDRKTTRGVVLAHSGNDILGFADGGTAAAVVPQLLAWMKQGGEQ